MNESSREQKAALRFRIRETLKGLPPSARRAASAQACSRLRQEPIWREAGSVLLYFPLSDELDIEPLLHEALAEGKELALPRFEVDQQNYLARRVLDLRQDLRPGRFGIPEPKAGCVELPLKQLDLVVAPGVGFTLDGCRLGRGRGFYDRLLAFVGGVRCGIGFDEQIVDAIPTEPHDIRLDCILTPTRWSPVVQSADFK